MQRQNSGVIAGAFLALGAAALFGTSGVFARLLYAYEISPIVVVWGRSLFAVVVLGIALAALRPAALRLDLRDVPFFLVLGFLGVALFHWLLFTSYTLTSIAVSTILLYTGPAFVTVLGAIFLQERVDRPKVAGLAATTVGLALIVGLLDAGAIRVSSLALLTGLGAGFLYAVYALMSKSALRRYSSWTVVFYGFAFGAPIQTAMVALSGSPIPAYSVSSLALHLGVSATVLIAYCLFVAALSRIEASRASILATAEPVFAAILALLFFGETLTPGQVFGGVLVLAGAIVAQLSVGSPTGNHYATMPPCSE